MLRRPRWSPEWVRTIMYVLVDGAKSALVVQELLSRRLPTSLSNIIWSSTFDIRYATFHWSRPLNPICESCHAPIQDIAPDMSCLLSTSHTTHKFTRLTRARTIHCADHYVPSMYELVSQFILLYRPCYGKKQVHKISGSWTPIQYFSVRSSVNDSM